MSTSAIILKKSSVVGKAPLTGDIAYGEVAINYADGRLYYKDASNNIKNFIDSDLIQSAIAASGSTQNTFSKIAVSGQSTIEADSTGDTLTFAAGSGITITTNATNDVVTITSTGGAIIAEANQVALDSFTGDSSTTNFTLSYEPGPEQNAFVTINGVSQHVTAYNIAGTSLSFTEAPQSGDDIEVRTIRLQSAEVSLRDYANFVYQPSTPTSILQDSDINGNVLTYDAGKVDVYLNGSLLTRNLDYTAGNGSSITLLGGVVDSGDTITINSFAKATIFDPNFDAYYFAFTSTDSDYTTTDSAQVVNFYNASQYRTVKYLVQLEQNSSNKYQATEILLTHNGTTAFMTEYGTITTDSNLGVFDADVVGGNVRLLVTPTLANVSIKSKRISIGA